MNYTLNFREVTYALSEALDLVGIDDVRHGKRVAFMAAECARAMGMDNEFIDEMIFLGMLHDSGVSTTDVHNNLVTQLEWKDEQIHCNRGAELLSKVTLFRGFAETVYYHHTHWDLLQTVKIGMRTRMQANLIYLVDRVDALRTQIEGPDLEKRDAIEHIIKGYSGRFFAPEVVEAFIAASRRNSFWFYLEDEALEAYLLEWVQKGETVSLSFDAVREVAQMFADIVDAKSPFTFEHSFGVAALSMFLARTMGLDHTKQEAIEIAALLHDLGKLRVDDDILNKHGPLSLHEKNMMDRHGFDSNMILRRIKGFREIALIASLHHEQLDGEGYPYNAEAREIPVEARIVTVADIFQALVQDRPYRKAMDANAAYAVLVEMVNAGKIDSDIVHKIGMALPEAYRVAKYKERAVVN